MFDIKEVITILCKYLSDTIDSPLTPEHFRLSKYDKKSDDMINAFWTTLDRLTFFALKEVNDNISFPDFDKSTRTKLRLAYLQYPCIDIYSLSVTENNFSSRALLLALTWIITKYEILSNVVRLKLLHSSLGKEFTKVDIENNREPDDARLSTLQNQINNLLQQSNKLSGNLKAISELYSEKIKLMTRVHAASITTSGLPHLSVSEMALIKKIATHRDDNEAELEKIKEMEKIASMLDTHIKWTKKNHVYYTWMKSVLEECEKMDESVYTKISLAELAKFIYLLRHVIKKRLKSLKNNDEFPFMSSRMEDCPSRLLRVQKCVTEAHRCLTETKNHFEVVDQNLKEKRAELEKELKSILNYIPNCIQV